MHEAELKELEWIGSARKDLLALPLLVRRVFGYALYVVQLGVKPPEAKPLKGFGGAGVLELTEDFKGDTYRAVYTVRFAAKVYVLHVFQKKAKHGIATPDHDLDLIRERLKRAEKLYESVINQNRDGKEKSSRSRRAHRSFWRQLLRSEAHI
jgi:phage-related protein